MSYECKILLDSIAPCGKRLASFVITFPRVVGIDFNTHRLISKSAASSRAIPTAKRIAAVRADPFVPAEFGRNQKGMSASENLRGWRAVAARMVWRLAARAACVFAWLLDRFGVHKQIANRVLEPYLWHTVIATATDFDNLFALRAAGDADPAFETIARMMVDAYAASTPTPLAAGEWHMPYITAEDRAQFSGEALRKISVGRCARVSYLNHSGKRAPQEDIALTDRIAAPGHMAPFEHVAMALDTPETSGNFCGWMQYRKLFADEHRGPRRADNKAPTLNDA